MAGVAEDKCPGCNTGTETGDGFEVSTVTCFNGDSPMRSFCVQCMRVLKFRPNAGMVSKTGLTLAKCKCTRSPKGEACFEERRTEYWQPKLHAISTEIPLDRRSLAVRAARALIESTLVEEDNYVQRFTRRAYVMILEGDTPRV